MARAAADQKIHHRAMGIVIGALPARRPADHLELVVVAVTDDVAASVGQTTDDIEMAGRRGPVHRVGVVPGSRAFTSSPRSRRKSTIASWPFFAASCNSVQSYGFDRR